MEDQKSVATQAIAPVATETKSLTTHGDGSLDLASMEAQKAYAQRMIESGVISETFKTPQQVIIAIQDCLAKKIDPREGLPWMYVVNNRPSFWGNGPLALVQRSGMLESIVEYFMDEKGDKICPANKNLKSPIWVSVTEVKRKGDPNVQVDWFSLDDLKKAGIDKKFNGQKKEVWEKYERDMIRYKGRTRALRSKFADVLMGISIAEQDFDFSPESDVPPRIVHESSAADDINRQYGKEEETPGQGTPQVG